MLTLRVLSYRDQPAPHLPAGYFAETGGLLGRGPDNHLVLEDPGKYISRTHARVRWHDGVYYLEDLGSNPSLVNDRPLGKGREIMLAEGDRIAIGDYQLLASVGDMPCGPGLPGPAQTTAFPPAPAARAAAHMLWSQVAPASFPVIATTPAALQAVELALAPTATMPSSLPSYEQPPAPGPVILPPSPALAAGTDHFVRAGLADLAVAPVPAGAPFALTGTDLLAGARILAAMPAASNGPGDDPLGLNLFVSSSATPLLSSMPGDPGHGLAPSLRGAESDHVSPERLPLHLLPSTAGTAGTAGTAAATAAPRALLPGSGHGERSSSTPAPGAKKECFIPHDYDPLSGLMPQTTPGREAVPAPATSGASHWRCHAGPVSVSGAASLSLPGSASLPALPETSTSTSVPPSPSPSPQASAAGSATAVPASARACSGSDSEILQALLRGLGLPGLPLNRPGMQVAETAGALLREATAGTMEILRARALTKKESRIEMTMIAANSNNPLKFFPNPDSALTQMLTGELAAYLAPVPAMRGAFNDLKAHELAVIAGMRAALAAVLHRFDPAVIESRLDQPGIMGRMMASQRKARLWDRLVALYGDIAREADEDLQRLFGEKFSQAYEEQVERLYRAGKQV